MSMHETHDDTKPYGLLAEFDHPDALVHATKQAVAAGYTKLDGYSPYAVGEVADALGYKKSEMGPVMFIGGLIGACSGFFMEVFLMAIDYPINIGGRPYVSWPMFIPVCFEMMVLTAALSGVFGLIALCGLPQPYHPLFNVPQFDRATSDRFFLCIESIDPKFDIHQTKEFLGTLQPLSIAEVPQ
jgi:hypothetical protein